MRALGVRRSAALFLLVATLFLAGCQTGIFDEGDSSPPTADVEPSPTESETLATTEATEVAPPTVMTTEPTTAPPPNPWRSEVVRIGVANQSQEETYGGIVQEAVSDWKELLPEHTPYSFQLEYVGENSPRDVTVSFEESLSVCDYSYSTDFLGCAVQLEPDDRVDHAEVEVETGYVRENLLDTTKHELGHVFSLSHESELPFMTSKSSVTWKPTPDVSERANPWVRENFLGELENVSTVTIGFGPSDSDQSDFETYLDEIRAVAEFYNSTNIEGIPNDLTFTTTSDSRNATILVTTPTVSESEFLDGGGASIGVWNGSDMDEDGEPEFYTRGEIQINDIPAENVAWHVATWIADFHHLPERAEMPPELQTDDRSGWERDI